MSRKLSLRNGLLHTSPKEPKTVFLGREETKAQLGSGGLRKHLNRFWVCSSEKKVDVAASGGYVFGRENSRQVRCMVVHLRTSHNDGGGPSTLRKCGTKGIRFGNIWFQWISNRKFKGRRRRRQCKLKLTRLQVVMSRKEGRQSRSLGFRQGWVFLGWGWRQNNVVSWCS